MPASFNVDTEMQSLVGTIHEDASGRTLKITAVYPDAQDGRQIVGRVSGTLSDGGFGVWYLYATDARTFRAIWLEQEPPWNGEGKQYG